MNSRKNGKEKNAVICRCEDVTLKEVEKAISEGFTTLSSIKRTLRCGMGACQGRSCLVQIAKILCQKTGKSMSEIDFPPFRFPTRPTRLATLSTNECEKRECAVEKD